MTERAVRARVEPHPSRQSRSKLTNHQSASVAQLVEQRTENPRVVGSIPTGGTIYADLAHLVERHLAKVEVAGSSPVIRSKEPRSKERGFSFSKVSLFSKARCCLVVIVLLRGTNKFEIPSSRIVASHRLRKTTPRLAPCFVEHRL